MVLHAGQQGNIRKGAAHPALFRDMFIKETIGVERGGGRCAYVGFWMVLLERVSWAFHGVPIEVP